MRFVTVYIILLIACVRLEAQHVYEKLTLDVGIGGEQYICNWASGNVTDNLINPTSMSFMGKIRLNYYFHRRWGIHADFQVGSTRITGNKEDEIPSRFTEPYEENYFVLGSKLTTDKEHLYGSIGIGGHWRYEKGSLAIIPRVSLGLSHIAADNCSFILKGKDNNEQYQMDYYVKGNKGDEYGLISRLFVSPGFQLSYRFKKLHIFMEASYIQYLKRMDYVMEKTELYVDGVHEKKVFKGQHYPSKYNLTVGLSIPISWQIK